MVFQDPMTALNPILTIGEQIYEVIHRSNAYGDDYDEKAISSRFVEKNGPIYTRKAFKPISS